MRICAGRRPRKDVTPSWFGDPVTFQGTLTEWIIAATVIAAAAHRFGWRGLALGSVLGATGVAVLAALQAAICRIARHWLDRISVLPPLGFGLQRAYEVTAGVRGRPGADVHPRGQACTCPSTPAGSVRASGIGSGGAGEPRGLARRVPAQ